MKRTRYSLVLVAFGLIFIMVLFGCGSGGDGDNGGGGQVADPAFNGTFRGNLTTAQGGQDSVETFTVTLTVGSPLSGTLSTDDGVNGTISGEVVGDAATFTGTLAGNCPGTIANGSASLMDDNTLSVNISGSDCNGSFSATGVLHRDEGNGGGEPTTGLNACSDNCQTARQVCGNTVFFEEYSSVGDCTDECVNIVEDFASDAPNFDACADAQEQFIECCTDRRQCGEIPDGCDAEFERAVIACGGSFGGCPLIFF